MSAPSVRQLEPEDIDHVPCQWWSPTLEQEQDWRDIERRDFMSHDKRLRPVERRKQEQLLFTIRDDFRREREQDRAMIASLRRSAVNGVYRMAAATGGNDCANRQQQIGSRSSVYTEQQHIGSGSQLDLALDTEPMYIAEPIWQPTGSSTLAPPHHGDTILYCTMLFYAMLYYTILYYTRCSAAPVWSQPPPLVLHCAPDAPIRSIGLLPVLVREGD